MSVSIWAFMQRHHHTAGEDDGVGIPDDAQNNTLSHDIERHAAARPRAARRVLDRSTPEGGTMIEVGYSLAPTSPSSTAASSPVL